MTKNISFYEMIGSDSDYKPHANIEKFNNLGNFSKKLPRFKNEVVETTYLIILNHTFFTLRVTNFEEIVLFLKEKKWFDEKASNFIIWQLHLEFIDVDEVWNERGVHPLDQKEKIEKLLKELVRGNYDV